MDQHKKALALLFMLIFAFSFCSVRATDVFAVGNDASELGKGPSSQGGGTDSAETGPASDVPAQGVASSKSPGPSSAPPSSKPPASSKTASSRRPRKKASSSVSSAVSSEVSSEVFSSEASSEIVLPSVGSIAENNPLSSAVQENGNQNKMNLIGVLSLACIALGVLVVLVVVFSNRRPPRGPGRKRYRRPKRSNRKRLLGDKYYRGLNRY